MSFVHVPEASVNKYDSPVLRQDYIRFSRIAFVVFAVAQTSGKQVLPYDAFRLCVGAFDGLHIFVSLFGG